MPSCQSPPGCPNPSAPRYHTMWACWHHPAHLPMAGWNSLPVKSLDKECAGALRGVKGQRVSQAQLLSHSQCPHWFREHSCSLPPSLLAAGVGGDILVLDHGAVRASRACHCPVSACGLHLATACPSSHSCSASSCSSWAAAGHGSSMPHAFASPTKVRGSLGFAPCLGGLRGQRASCREKKDAQGLGAQAALWSWLYSPHSGPPGCFRGAASSTVPEDAVPVLLP